MIRCHGYDLIHDVVEYDGWDIYATLHGHILDLSGTLLSQGVSDNDTIRVYCRLRGGSNNTDIPGQWQCGNCAATPCWPVRRNCYRCGASTPAPWNAGKSKGRNKGPLGRDPLPGLSNVPPTVREPHVMPPRGQPGAGVGTPPAATDSPVASGGLLGALNLLLTVMSAEDFYKYEKMIVPPSKAERTKEREQLLWEKGQSSFTLLTKAGRLPPRSDPLCGQWAGAKFCESELQDAMVQASGALSADVDGARCFENTGLCHVPKLHGDPLRGRRGRGWRTGSSSLLMKRRSSPTLSRSQACGRPSACAARAEAGGSHDNFASFFDRCADRVTRICRVTSVMHHNLGFTPHTYSTARNSQFAHSRATVLHGRVSLNSENSVGDTEAGGQRFCAPGETKSLSTSTRRGVRRSAVDESAHPQQTPLKLHGETWAGLLRNHGPKIFREVEIVPGCAVAVARPSCPDYSPEPPGPGRIIRNMLGWTLEEKTDQSGVWVFRGALQGENLFSSLDAFGDWEWKGSYHTAWAVPCDSSCTCSYAYGQGPRYRATFWKAVLATARRFVEGYRTPDEAMVC